MSGSYLLSKLQGFPLASAFSQSSYLVSFAMPVSSLSAQEVPLAHPVALNSRLPTVPDSSVITLPC